MRSEYVTICITPLLCSGGGKKFRPPPEEGASRLPNTGSASAYPCAEDIIARFVEFGKVWGAPRRRAESFRPPVLSLRGGAKPRRGNPSPALSVSCADSSPTGGAKLGLSGPHRPLPPPLGEVPPQGAERVSPAKKKSPGGGLGIDFFPYHVILKIKRGAAGRREPLRVTKK